MVCFELVEIVGNVVNTLLTSCVGEGIKSGRMQTATYEHLATVSLKETG